MRKLNTQRAVRLRQSLKRLYDEFFEDRIPTVAGGITFFVLLALFPAISATVALFGMFSSRREISRDLDLVSGFLPEGGVKILRDELQRLASQPPVAINTAFFISFAIALWSASGGYKALVEGLNVAFEVPERRSFLTQTVNALIFTVSGIIFAAVAVALGLTLPRLQQREPAAGFILQILTWPTLFVACTLILAVIYRFGPDRPHPRWRWITWGSATASLLWVFGTLLFTWYVHNFGSYNRIYGNLGAAVGFLTWVWLSVVILLLGAEINCELERSHEIVSKEDRSVA
jgi:membrane protein